MLGGDHLQGLWQKTGQPCDNSHCHAAKVLVKAEEHMCSCYFLASQFHPSIRDIFFTAKCRDQGHPGGKGAKHPPTEFDSWQQYLQLASVIQRTQLAVFVVGRPVRDHILFRGLAGIQTEISPVSLGAC